MTIIPPLIKYFDRDTIKLLRIPFSYHLMPVFLFALSQSALIDWINTLAVFIILHLLVYPASNGYNSYMDQDQGSIGGIKSPPKAGKNLFYVTLLFDLLAILSAFLVSRLLALLVLIYILASRAYSFKGLRLKRYPFTGFFTVMFFQGAFTYALTWIAVCPYRQLLSPGNIMCMGISSLFIGSVYPLTQIYQHEEDTRNGDHTLSNMLGYKGTFMFSICLFTIATVLLYYYFYATGNLKAFVLFLLFLLPATIYMLIWFRDVKRNTKKANYENTMRMNGIASTCMNLYFLLLLLNKVFNFF